MSREPIAFEYSLRCDTARAFDTYTRRIGDWWDPRYTANAETLEGVTIEPRVGGRVYATHGDPGEHDWGEVTVADDNDSERCTVRFAHGWTDANIAVREKFGDWQIMLERFAALAESGR